MIWHHTSLLVSFSAAGQTNKQTYKYLFTSFRSKRYLFRWNTNQLGLGGNISSLLNSSKFLQISTLTFLACLKDDFVLIKVETQERMPRKISSARARERDAERARFLEEQERVYHRTKSHVGGIISNKLYNLLNLWAFSHLWFLLRQEQLSESSIEM